MILRAWRVDDADWYAAATRDDEIQRWTREGDVTPAQMRDAIQRLAGRAGQLCIAEDDDEQRPLGNIGWKELDEPGVVEGYYWVSAEGRGRGIASAALAEVFDRAVATGAHRMILVIDAGNVASERTAERAGFVRIAADADRVTYERCS